jgi:flagellar assembly factor FliW
MIKFETSRFGALEVKEDRIIQFPEGIPGFPEIKRYVLIDYKDTPLKWLHAVDDPDIAFIVTEPKTVSADYSVKTDAATRQYLNLDNEDDLAVFLILRVENGNMIPNFNGPLLINAGNMTGIQAVLDRV